MVAGIGDGVGEERLGLGDEAGEGVETESGVGFVERGPVRADLVDGVVHCVGAVVVDDGPVGVC